MNRLPCEGETIARDPVWRWWSCFLLVIFVALGVRIACVFVYRAHIAPELWEPERLALNLLSGRGYVLDYLGTVYRSYQEPLYPLLVYAVYWITGHSYLALALVQSVLGTALVLVVAGVAGLVLGPHGALSAAALVAVDPGLVRYTAKFHPLILDALFLSLVVLATLWAARVGRPLAHVGLGVALGLCVLTRPTVVVVVPIIAMWFIWRNGGASGRRQRLLLLLLALGLAAAIVAPWVARNYAVHERFILTRTNTPFVFWLGNHPGWTGSATTLSGESLLVVAPPELRRRLLERDELGQNDLFREEAMRFVAHDPGGFVRRTAIKLFYFWWFSPQFGVRYSAEPVWFYRVFYGLAAGLAVLGLVLLVAGRFGGVARADGVVLGCSLLALSIAQSAFYVEGRHRLAVEALLLVFSGAGMTALISSVPSYANALCSIRRGKRLSKTT